MARATYDRELVRRELFSRSALLTRASHALEAAAQQLREAPGTGSWSKCSAEIHTAAMTAMHGALGALELIGEYRMAAYLDEIASTKQ